DPAAAVITSIPLNTIVAIQFVPLLAIVAVIATFICAGPGLACRAH
ncbi:MAG: hypothetical protein JWR49_2719, partial [Tardiphaga sp.]|nr:hypothetical protein [Tardiphaga sp.]